jgi:hypothetical protein
LTHRDPTPFYSEVKEVEKPLNTSGGLEGIRLNLTSLTITIELEKENMVIDQNDYKNYIFMYFKDL